MKATKWLTKRMAMAIHDEAIAMFGGDQGLRDEAVLDAVFENTKNLHAYGGDTTLHKLAASLCVGITKNRPFMDGNTRTALIAAHAFLFLNGIDFEPLEEDEINGMRAAAGGELDAAVLAEWFESFSTARAA